MGLAGTRVKQRFGIDPRNTTWSNDTSRFGHQHLVKLGWEPGKGLGLTNNALTSHIKITVKNDNVGLGSNLAKKRAKQDEFDSGENVHLDVFQRLLGRLNGKEEQINQEVERKRTERIINGRWGVHFVKGDTLRSTWDKENRQLVDTETPKRKREDDIDTKITKKSKKEKKGNKEKKEKKGKKEKKEKKGKKSKGDKITRESMLKPKAEASNTSVLGSKMALRSKWIRQKRAAIMDEKALQEIFMIK